MDTSPDTLLMLQKYVNSLHITWQIVILISGLLLTYFGTHLYKIAIWLFGFAIGIVVVQPFITSHTDIEKFIYTGIAGVIFGFVVLYVVYLAIFVIGAAIGGFVFSQVKTTYLVKKLIHIIGHDATAWIFIIAGGLLFLLISLVGIIFYTAFSGAYITTNVIISWILKLRDSLDRLADWVDNIDKLMILYSVFFGFFFFTGVLVQFLMNFKLLSSEDKKEEDNEQASKDI